MDGGGHIIVVVIAGKVDASAKIRDVLLEARQAASLESTRT